MLRKLKFYFLGLIPGLVIVFFILNKKGASCSGYLPNSRVIAESLSKNLIFSPNFKAQMQDLKIDETFLKDSIMTNGKVDFDKSHAQQKPCPDYLLSYPKQNARYEITFQKCEDQVTFWELKKIK